MVWYEKFYGNPEGSLPKTLQRLIVGRNPQRPGIEESVTNNIPVGNKVFPKRPIPSTAVYAADGNDMVHPKLKNLE